MHTYCLFILGFFKDFIRSTCIYSLRLLNAPGHNQRCPKSSNAMLSTHTRDRCIRHPFLRSDMDNKDGPIIQIKESKEAKLFSNTEILKPKIDLFFADLLLMLKQALLPAVHSWIHESVSQTGELRAKKSDNTKQEIDKNSIHIIGNNEDGLLVYVSDRLCFVIITDAQKTRVVKAAVILRNKFVCTRS